MGFCADCEHVAVCRGGCLWTVVSSLGVTVTIPTAITAHSRTSAWAYAKRLELIEPAPVSHSITECPGRRGPDAGYSWVVERSPVS